MQRIAAFLVLVLALLADGADGADAQRYPTSTPDPFLLNYTTAGGVNFGTTNTSLTTQSVNPAIQNCILIGTGQSNSPGASVTPDGYLPVNASSLDYMNINDGGIYRAVDPMAGSAFVNNFPPAGGAPILRLADALVTAAKCARVIMMPIAIDATSIADWATGIYANRTNVAIRRLAVKGIVPGPNVTFVILWGQGESDTLAGTSSPSYQASFAIMKANAGCPGCRWLVATQSYVAGIGVSAAVQNGQAAVRNGGDTFAGANADALLGNVCVGGAACRQVDGTHWADAGGQSYATDATNGWQSALHASGAPF